MTHLMAPSHSTHRLLTFKSLPPIFILPTHLQPEELHEIEDQIFSLDGSLTYDPKEAKIFLGRITQKKRAAFDLRARGVWTVEAALPPPLPLPKTSRSSYGREHMEKEKEEEEEARDEGPARKKVKVEAEHSERDRRAEARHNRRKSKSPSLSSTVSVVSITTTTGDVDTDADVDADPVTHETDQASPSAVPESFWHGLSDNHILILKLSWLETCLSQQQLIPYEPYVIYAAKVIPRPAGEASPRPLQENPVMYTSVKATAGTGSTSTSSPATRKKANVTTSILERAKAEASSLGPSSSSGAYPGRRRYGDHHNRESGSGSTSRKGGPPKLYRTTTSEFEDLAAHPLPPLPEWAQGPYAAYSCCRSTPMSNANAGFVAQLTRIREGRILTLDEIGVRAYSTSIASIAAYPYAIRHPDEINRLPGCNEKIAMLWSEWFHSAEQESERRIQAVQDLDHDVDLQHLRLFWNIWGVGPETARKFYYEHGWQDLNDVVEFGWSTLTRVQQIGVKYYDEFQQKIPRAEVDQIGAVIHRHARAVLDIEPAQYGSVEDVECIVVGGYRRGKQASGDVDVVISHRDESKTQDLVGYIVRSLELEGWITHTLTLHTTTSDRGQATLPFRAERRGHGFDSLDKALCVWQDPHFEVPPSSTDADGSLGLEGGGGGGDNGSGGGGGRGREDGKRNTVKNPNIHRRVDIIISSWRTVGCAVLGWSGGNTFQRDLRRFVAKTRGWKFDSSGVRDRGNGMVLELEGPKTRSDTKVIDPGTHIDVKSISTYQVQGTTHQGGPSSGGGGGGGIIINDDDADTWHDRERRLMNALGIGYRPPEERCTG